MLASGDGPPVALTGGYHAAFLVGAIFAAVGVLGALLLRPAAPPGTEVAEGPVGAEPSRESA